MGRKLLHPLCAWLSLVAGLGMVSCARPVSDVHDPNTVVTAQEVPVNSSFSGPPKASVSRGRPPSVSPIVHDGIRYEQLKAPSTKGLAPGGYVVATEVATRKQLWVSRVYQTVVDPRVETDVQMTFFKSMSLDARGDALVIQDEKGRTFHVDLADGKVH